MDYEVIEKQADDFKQDQETCEMIAKVLDGVVNVLKASLFGAILFAKIIKWLEGISKALKKLAEVFEEFSADLLFAVGRHKEGDFDGMSKFGEGVQ
ncbi:MAG: hypothetical protein ACERKX_12675, partial [Anaerolineales bacterium]